MNKKLLTSLAAVLAVITALIGLGLSPSPASATTGASCSTGVFVYAKYDGRPLGSRVLIDGQVVHEGDHAGSGTVQYAIAVPWDGAVHTWEVRFSNASVNARYGGSGSVGPCGVKPTEPPTTTEAPPETTEAPVETTEAPVETTEPVEVVETTIPDEPTTTVPVVTVPPTTVVSPSPTDAPVATAAPGTAPDEPATTLPEPLAPASEQQALWVLPETR